MVIWIDTNNKRFKNGGIASIIVNTLIARGVNMSYKELKMVMNLAQVKGVTIVTFRDFVKFYKGVKNVKLCENR